MPGVTFLAIRQLHEIGFVWIEVVRLQVAVRRRPRIDLLVDGYDGIGHFLARKIPSIRTPIALHEKLLPRFLKWTNKR